MVLKMKKEQVDILQSRWALLSHATCDFSIPLSGPGAFSEDQILALPLVDQYFLTASEAMTSIIHPKEKAKFRRHLAYAQCLGEMQSTALWGRMAKLDAELDAHMGVYNENKNAR